MSNEQKRIILWTAPRTMGTPMFRSMSSRKNIKTIFEPYLGAYYFGPDRTTPRNIDASMCDPKATFAAGKAVAEDPYNGFAEVFVKEQAFSLTGKLDTMAYLPSGYRHAFLIRHPRKSVVSLYNVTAHPDFKGAKLETNFCVTRLITAWSTFEPAEAGVKELWEMFELIQRETGETPFVMDADDVLATPEKCLRVYCERMEIPFEEAMIKWKPVDPQLTTDFADWKPWVEKAFSANGFSKEKGETAVDAASLPPEVEKCIKACEPFYNKLAAYKCTCE